MVKVNNSKGRTGRGSSKKHNISSPGTQQQKTFKIEGQSSVNGEQKNQNWKRSKKPMKNERKIQKALKKPQNTKKPEKIDKKMLRELNKKLFIQIQTATKKEQILEKKQKEKEIDIEQFLNEAFSPGKRIELINQDKKLDICQKLLKTLLESKEENVNQLINVKYIEQIMNKTLRTYVELFIQSSSPSISQYQNIFKSCRNQRQLLNIIAVLKKIETHPYYIRLDNEIRNASNQKLVFISIEPNCQKNESHEELKATKHEILDISSLSHSQPEQNKEYSLELINYLSNESSSHLGKKQREQKIWESEMQDNNLQDILQ